MDKCVWVYDGSIYYTTSCGGVGDIIDLNKAKKCPYCGKEIKVRND